MTNQELEKRIFEILADWRQYYDLEPDYKEVKNDLIAGNVK